MGTRAASLEVIHVLLTNVPDVSFTYRMYFYFAKEIFIAKCMLSLRDGFDNQNDISYIHVPSHLHCCITRHCIANLVVLPTTLPMRKRWYPRFQTEFPCLV